MDSQHPPSIQVSQSVPTTATLPYDAPPKKKRHQVHKSVTPHQQSLWGPPKARQKSVEVHHLSQPPSQPSQTIPYQSQAPPVLSSMPAPPVLSSMPAHNHMTTSPAKPSQDWSTNEQPMSAQFYGSFGNQSFYPHTSQQNSPTDYQQLYYQQQQQNKLLQSQMAQQQTQIDSLQAAQQTVRLHPSTSHPTPIQYNSPPSLTHTTSTPTPQYCFYHKDQILTNFCMNDECLLPMCPACISAHSSDHQCSGIVAHIETLGNVCSNLESNLQQQQYRLGSAMDQLRVLAGSQGEWHQNMQQKFSDIRQTLYMQVDQVLAQLDSDLQSDLQRQQQELNRETTRLQQQAAEQLRHIQQQQQDVTSNVKVVIDLLQNKQMDKYQQIADHAQEQAKMMQGCLVDVKLDEQGLVQVRDAITQMILVKNYRPIQPIQFMPQIVESRDNSHIIQPSHTKMQDIIEQQKQDHFNEIKKHQAERKQQMINNKQQQNMVVTDTMSEDELDYKTLVDRHTVNKITTPIQSMVMQPQQQRVVVQQPQQQRVVIQQPQAQRVVVQQPQTQRVIVQQPTVQSVVVSPPQNSQVVVQQPQQIVQQPMSYVSQTLPNRSSQKQVSFEGGSQIRQSILQREKTRQEEYASLERVKSPPPFMRHRA